MDGYGMLWYILTIVHHTHTISHYCFVLAPVHEDANMIGILAIGAIHHIQNLGFDFRNVINVGKTIINHPPIITIDSRYKPFPIMGGLLLLYPNYITWYSDLYIYIYYDYFYHHIIIQI